MDYQQDSSRTQSRNDLGVKFVKTVISVCLVQVIVTRSWAKTHKHAQIRKIGSHTSNFLSSLLSGVGLTSGKVDMLEVKRNPGHFCKHVDRAAGLGEQVEIEFHRVCRLRELALGSLGDFHSSPTARDPSVFPETPPFNCEALQFLNSGDSSKITDRQGWAGWPLTPAEPNILSTKPGSSQVYSAHICDSEVI